MDVNSSLFPKETAEESIATLLSRASYQDDEKELRSFLLKKANTLPTVLQYGLGMKAEYAGASALLDQCVDIRHDIKLMGGAKIIPLSDLPALRSQVLKILRDHSETFYDALIGATWKQHAVVEFSQDGDALHLSSQYAGVHNELLVLYVRSGIHAHVYEVVKGTTTAAARTIIAVVEKGASLDYHGGTSAQLSGTIFLRQYGVLDEGARLSWFDVAQSRAHTYTRTVSELRGRESSSQIFMTSCVDQDRVLDVEHRVYHYSSYTKSRIAAAGVGKGTSRTIYRGDIVIDKGTVRTEGKQEGKFLILDATAKIDAVPALDVSAHDVMSAHALSVGYLSPKMLFYPRLRGLRAEDAVGFLVSGMMKQTLARGGAPERDAYEMSRIGESLSGVLPRGHATYE